MSDNMELNFSGIGDSTSALLPAPDDATLIAALESELATQISTVTIVPPITNAESYVSASFVLSTIQSLNKSVAFRLEDKIVPRRAVLDLWYALRRRLLDPLDQAETLVKSRMAKYKMDEARAIREQEQKHLEETQKQSQLAQDALNTAATASDAITRARARIAAKKLSEQAEVSIAQQAPVAPIRVSTSSAVPTQKPEVSDLRLFLQGILDGHIPEEMVQVHSVNINAYWKISKAKVKEWPGVTVVEGMGIRGR